MKPAALIVWKTDRIARNRVDSALSKKAIRDAGCTIHYVAEAIPQEAPEAAMMEGLLESMAEFYSRQLRQNIVRGMRYNAEHCYYNGHKMLGYMPEAGKKANRKILVDPDTAPIVQRIFTNYAAGKQLQAIANELNEQGLRTVQGKKFTVNSLRHTLHNDAYTGVYRYSDIVIENGIPALVSKDLFEKAQARFAENKRKGAQVAAGMADDESPRYWLTGKLFCGYCGESMQGVSGTSKTGAKHYYYYCSGQRKHQCEKRPIRKDIIENAVESALHDILANPENAFRIADAAVGYYNSHYKDTSYLDGLEAALKDTQKALNNLVKAIEMGIFSESTQQRLLELESRKKDIQDSIEAEKAKRKLMDDQHSIQAYFSRFNDPGSFLFDDAVRDAALDYFVHKIYVYDGRIIITGSFCDGYIYDIPLEALDEEIEFDPFAVGSTNIKACDCCESQAFSLVLN